MPRSPACTLAPARRLTFRAGVNRRAQAAACYLQALLVRKVSKTQLEDSQRPGFACSQPFRQTERLGLQDPPEGLAVFVPGAFCSLQYRAKAMPEEAL